MVLTWPRRARSTRRRPSVSPVTNPRQLLPAGIGQAGHPKASPGPRQHPRGLRPSSRARVARTAPPRAFGVRCANSAQPPLPTARRPGNGGPSFLFFPENEHSAPHEKTPTPGDTNPGCRPLPRQRLPGVRLRVRVRQTLCFRTAGPPGPAGSRKTKQDQEARPVEHKRARQEPTPGRGGCRPRVASGLRPDAPVDPARVGGLRKIHGRLARQTDRPGPTPILVQQCSRAKESKNQRTSRDRSNTQ